jgi:hypothetical protein
MDIPTGKKMFLLFWLPQNDIFHKMLVCVLWFYFLPFSGAAAIHTFVNTGPK